MFKKMGYFPILLSIVLALLLTACSGGGGKTTGGGNKDSNAQGVTEDEILVGYLGPQTGQTAVYDLYRKGSQSYFNYLNENGGINGRKLVLKAYDDEYQPAKAVQLAKRLVEEDKVFAILGQVCTPCNAAVKDYYVEKGIPMVMVGSGASQFTDPPVENYMGSNIMNYRIEAKVFLDYAVKKLGAKRIALAYQNDDFGKEGYQAVKDQVGKYDGVEIVEEVNYQAGDVEFSAQAKKLKNANPDAIFAFAVTEPAANLKKAIHKIGLRDAAFFASSVGANDTNLFNLAGEEVWNGTITSAVFPMPDQSDDQDMELYIKQFSKDYPNEPLAGYAQIGWAAAQVFAEAVKRTEGNLNWDNFLKSFYTFDNWQGSMYEGVTFSKGNHFGLTSLLLVEAKGGKIVPTTDTITFDPESGNIDSGGQW